MWPYSEKLTHLWTRKWVLTRHHIYWWLDLGFPILQKQGIGRVRTSTKVIPKQTLDPVAISACYSVAHLMTSLHWYTFSLFESNRPLFYSISQIILHMLPFFYEKYLQCYKKVPVLYESWKASPHSFSPCCIMRCTNEGVNATFWMAADAIDLGRVPVVHLLFKWTISQT